MLINILIHRQISNSKLIVFTIVHKDFKKTLVLMVEVMAVNYIIFNNFMEMIN